MVTNVFIVDDDKDTLGMLSEVLQEAENIMLLGAESNPNLAARHIQSLLTPPHVLLTDINMPGLGGRELAAAATRCWPHLRVIFFSGEAGEDTLDGHTRLRKPLGNEELIETIRKVADH